MKIYTFYFQGKLYAHTNNKDHRNMFMNQRNMSVFKYNKIKMSDDEYLEFLKQYRMQTIDEFIYGSYGESGYTTIASTYLENDRVEMTASSYDDEIRTICDQLLCIDGLHCRDSIHYMMDIFRLRYIGNEKYPVSMINALSIFVNLYKDTLV